MTCWVYEVFDVKHTLEIEKCSKMMYNDENVFITIGHALYFFKH